MQKCDSDIILDFIKRVNVYECVCQMNVKITLEQSRLKQYSVQKVMQALKFL